MSRRFRFPALVVLAVSLSLAAAPSAQGRGPVRTGAILGPAIAPTGPPSCATAADCDAWVASGCDERFVGLDPAVSASVVDVRRLAGSRRVLRIDAVLSGWVFDVMLEFWSANCEPVVSTFSSFSHIGPAIHVSDGSRIRIPRDARWMTLVAFSPRVRWQLY
jgi:hypothetical protein